MISWLHLCLEQLDSTALRHHSCEKHTSLISQMTHQRRRWCQSDVHPWHLVLLKDYVEGPILLDSCILSILSALALSDPGHLCGSFFFIFLLLLLLLLLPMFLIGHVKHEYSNSGRCILLSLSGNPSWCFTMAFMVYQQWSAAVDTMLLVAMPPRKRPKYTNHAKWLSRSWKSLLLLPSPTNPTTQK